MGLASQRLWIHVVQLCCPEHLSLGMCRNARLQFRMGWRVGMERPHAAYIAHRADLPPRVQGLLPARSSLPCKPFKSKPLNPKSWAQGLRSQPKTRQSQPVPKRAWPTTSGPPLLKIVLVAPQRTLDAKQASKRRAETAETLQRLQLHETRPSPVSALRAGVGHKPRSSTMQTWEAANRAM